MQTVFDFGFGKAAAGTTTPAIYIAGYVNGTFGIYQSVDDAQTWKQIGGPFPFNDIDAIAAVSGDMNIYGRVYVGFRGSGFVYGDIRQ